jgi:5,10-methylenetetrahydromethanopterin reductase
MRLGLRVPACESTVEVANFIAHAEAGGFDYAWVPDTQMLAREVWITLGLAATRTARIGLGTGVSNPATRDVSVTGTAAATVDELAPGRVVFGLGSGHSSVRIIGMKTSRIQTMRDYVEQLRQLWAGEMISPRGRTYRLRNAPGRQIPVYISATGPNMLQFAGEVADGVLLMAGLTSEALDYGLTNIEIGARRAGRRLEDVAVTVGTFCHVGPDARAIRKLAQPYAANFAIRHREALRDAGVPVPDAGTESGLYPDLIHCEDWQRAIEVTNWIPDDVVAEFADKFCLFGSSDEIIGKIRHLESLGVRDLFVRGISTYELPSVVLEAFVERVIPAFQARRLPAKSGTS